MVDDVMTGRGDPQAQMHGCLDIRKLAAPSPLTSIRVVGSIANNAIRVSRPTKGHC